MIMGSNRRGSHPGQDVHSELVCGVTCKLGFKAVDQLTRVVRNSGSTLQLKRIAGNFSFLFSWTEENEGAELSDKKEAWRERS